MILLRIDLVNARFLANRHPIREISIELLQKFPIHFHADLEPFRRREYLSCNLSFLHCLLESLKQLPEIGWDIHLATKHAQMHWLDELICYVNEW